MSKKDKKNYITTPVSSNPTPAPQDKKPNFTVIIIIITAFLVFAFLLVKYFTENESGNSNKQGDAVLAPSFKKEGELAFIHSNEKDTILKLDIEIADNDAERAQGLMYRPNMPETQAMLFVFQTAEPQQFWMKNTIMSLDIVYVGADSKVISIQKNAKPFSEEPLPSDGNAMYVVEVNAGFCDKYHIDKGDLIKFTKTVK